MNALSKKLRATESGQIVFWCPGCKETHGINIGEGSGARWGYNGDPEKPTFTPSILVTNGHFCPGRASDACWCTYYADHPDDVVDFKCGICHSFVTDGKIQFLNDCSHELAGQTVDLPDWIDHAE